MVTFSGTDANRAIVAYFGSHSAAMPEHTRDKMAEALAGTDALAAIITTLEALYAARAVLDAAGMELLDGLARFVGAHNFYGVGSRAAQISGVAMRMMNGGVAEADGDPPIEPGFEAPEPVMANNQDVGSS